MAKELIITDKDLVTNPILKSITISIDFEIEEGNVIRRHIRQIKLLSVRGSLEKVNDFGEELTMTEKTLKELMLEFQKGKL